MPNLSSVPLHTNQIWIYIFVQIFATRKEVALLPSWWKKLYLKDLSISELFEELLSWNLESKLITPKYITGTYFGAIVAIFNFCFSVCFLCVMFFLTPEQALKAGPATCFPYLFNFECRWLFYKKKYVSR